jgi:acetyl esterase
MFLGAAFGVGMIRPASRCEAYGRKLIKAGVEVVTTRYNATIHDFVMLNALAEAAPTRAAVTQALDFLKEVLAPKR